LAAPEPTTPAVKAKVYRRSQEAPAKARPKPPLLVPYSLKEKVLYTAKKACRQRRHIEAYYARKRQALGTPPTTGEIMD
jgi:hypothetical protein